MPFLRRLLLIAQAPLILIAVGLGSFVAPVAATTFGYDQLSYTPGAMGVTFNDPGKQMAVSFTLPPAMNGKQLASVKFYVQKINGAVFPMIVELRNDSNGLPTGSLIAQSSFTPAPMWSTAVFAQHPTLQSGITYHLLVHPQAGCGDSDNWVNVVYQLIRYRTDMSQELNFGAGWFTHPNADPTCVLLFSDGTRFGQASYGSLYDVYGSGANCRFGERFVLSSPMTVRKVSFVVNRVQYPTANLRVKISEEATGAQLVDDVFSIPMDCTTWDSVLQSHVLSSTVNLSANTPYKMCLYMEGYPAKDLGYYTVPYRLSESSDISFGGASCYAYSETSAGVVTTYPTQDANFRLDSGVVELVNLTPQLVSSTGITVAVGANIAANAQIEYGATTGYGTSLTSSNLINHRFLLTGLSPGTLYHYRVTLTNPNDPSDVVVTGDNHFTTTPISGAINVCVIGDTQSMDYNTITHLAATYPRNLVLTVGDNVGLQELALPDTQQSYNIGMNEWRWFLRDITPLTKDAPLYTALGNHDAMWVPHLMSAYRDSVSMPSNGSGDGRYYSFDYGPAHFVILDVMSYGQKVDAVQLSWMQSDLAASSKPWKIVILHAPVFGSLSTSCISNASAVHTALKNGGVKLVLAGHVHAYNRYCKDGVSYVTNSIETLWGNGAADGFEAGYTGDPFTNVGGDPGTLSAALTRPGWTQLQISDTSLHGDFIDSLGRTLDGFTIPSSMVVTFSPDGGQFASETTATVSCATPGSVIHYTTDGRDPTAQDTVIASGGSVPINKSLTLRARAFKGSDTSDIKSSSYALRVASPLFSPGSGWYGLPRQITVTSPTPNSVVHYTTNGLDPTVSDPIASGPILIAKTLTIKAKGWEPNLQSSPVSAASYEIAPIHVLKQATGPIHDGTSWDKAYTRISDALSASIVSSEIWVAGSSTDNEAGTYHEAVTLKEGVTLLGGFSGTETAASQRNPNYNITTIDGGNASAITAPSGITPVTWVDGFTVRNGQGTQVGSNRCGGGVYCVGSPVLTSLTITGNSATYGAGVYCASGTSPSLTNCLIIGNTSSQQGGGVYGGGSMILMNNTIASNTSTAGGGGVYCVDGTPNLTNNIVAFNSTGVSKATISSPTLRNNCVFGNTSGNYSGLNAGTGDISADPGFVYPAGSNYRLSAGSPCIDVGNATGAPSVDQDGVSRPADGNGDGTAAMDIGCYEWSRRITSPTTAKGLIDYTPVSISGCVISATLSDRFYIENMARTFGIGVFGSPLSLGKSVTVYGYMTTSNGERMVQATSITEAIPAVPPAVPAPLGISLKALGGGSCVRQQAVSGWDSLGASVTALGLNNVGLLVRVYGKVTQSTSSQFYVDDGFGLNDGNPAVKGACVDWPFGTGTPPVGSFIQLDAISSCKTVVVGGKSYIVRLLRPISSSAVIVMRYAPGT